MGTAAQPSAFHEEPHGTAVMIVKKKYSDEVLDRIKAILREARYAQYMGWKTRRLSRDLNKRSLVK